MRGLPLVRHQSCHERCQNGMPTCAAQCKRAIATLKDHFTHERWWQFWRRLPEPRLTEKEETRLQRLRDRAYYLQNKLDERPRYRMDHTRAELSALCWAIEKISGKPFTPVTSRDATQEGNLGERNV